jgi:hypothetical protein
VKTKDWAMIILVVVVVGVASYFIVNAIVPRPTEKPETVRTATAISTSITEPSPTVFYDGAINPTVKSEIGNIQNESPFRLGSE